MASRSRADVEQVPAAGLVTGVVLAGGESTRFGRPKWKARLDGRTLLERAVGVLDGWCEEVIVVAPPHASTDLRGAGANTRVVEDLPLGRGPLVGLASGLAAARTPLNAVIACDMPFGSSALLQHLACLAEGYDAVIPRVEGRVQPLHAVYRRGCAEPMRVALASGVFSPSDFLRLGEIRVRYAEEDEVRAFSPDGSAFLNVNTQQELARARRLLRSTR